MRFMETGVALIILSSSVAGCTGNATAPSGAGAGLGGAAQAGSSGSGGSTVGGTAGVGGTARTGGSAGTGETSGSGGTSGAGGQGEYLAPEPPPCEGAPAMVGARLKNGDCFKIDSRPVTRGEWRAFEEETGEWVYGASCEGGRGTAPSIMPPRGELGHNMNPDDLCWDNSIDSDYPDPGLLHWPPSDEEDALPMVCITWCQAALYCEKQGKHLCAPYALEAFKAGEGSIAVLDGFADLHRNEWFAACSAEGTRAYPYGTGLIEDACPPYPGPRGDVYDDWTFKGWATDSYDATCQGGYQGLYMMGALREWIATCFDGGLPGDGDSVRCFTPNGSCRVESFGELALKHDPWGDLTFRCCSR